MGKIGDLIVRLQLKHDDYKKGLKQAEKDTKGFGTTLGKIKGAGVAVWAAIGASVISFGKQLINSSQRIGDAWNRMTSQMKGGWDVFVQSVGNWNWNNFIGRIKEASIAAKELTNALDAEFEVSNSIRLQKSAMAEELAELEVLARDQTKTYEERAAAAQKYLDKVKPLYDQELQLAQKLEDVHLGKFLAGSGLQDTEQVRQDLRKFLVDIGRIPTLMDDLAAKSAAQKTIDKGVNAWGSNYQKVNAAYDVRNQMHNKLKDIQSGYQTDLVALFRAYNDMRGDEDAKPMVDAMVRAGEAAGAFNRETKRMQSALNTSLAHTENEESQKERDQRLKIEQELDQIDKWVNQLKAKNRKIEIPLDFEFDTDLEEELEKFIDETSQQITDGIIQEQQEVKALNDMLKSAIVDSMSGTTQAFTDMLMGIEGADASQVLAAMLQPFANTMTQLGEMLIIQGLGIQAFKDSLKELDPAIALGAGAALLAMGAALSSGIKMLGANAGGTTASTSASNATSGSSSIDRYQQEIVVKVVGEIAGDKIILAGERTLNKWNR